MATKVEKALQQLREDLYHDIMLNTTEGDDCDYCKAYRHAAEIVMGTSVAQPPALLDMKEN